MFYRLAASLNFAVKWFSIGPLFGQKLFARLATEHFVSQTRCWTKMFGRLAGALLSCGAVCNGVQGGSKRDDSDESY